MLTGLAQDTNRLNIYRQICWIYLNTQTELDTARHYADSLHLLAKKLNNEYWIQRSGFFYGVLARFEGNYPDALRYLNENLRYFQNKGDSNRVSVALFQLANVFDKMGNFAAALSCYYRHIAIEKQLGFYESVPNARTGIGNVFFEARKYSHAVETYKEAAGIYDSLGDSSGKYTVFTNLGNVYIKIEKFDIARQCYNNSLAYAIKNKLPDRIALNVANLAFLFDGLKKYDSALMYRLWGLDISKKLPSKE